MLQPLSGNKQDGGGTRPTLYTNVVGCSGPRGHKYVQKTDYPFYLSMVIKGQGGASWRLTTRPEYRVNFTLIGTGHKSDIYFKNE